MVTPTTPVDLEALKRVAKEATPGPTCFNCDAPATVLATERDKHGKPFTDRDACAKCWKLQRGAL